MGYPSKPTKWEYELMMDIAKVGSEITGVR